MVRFNFKRSKDREEFFNRLRKEMEVSTWKEFREKLNLSRATSQRYRYGKSTMPEKIFFEMLKFLPKDEKRTFLRKISVKKDNWGEKKGGQTTYSKHKQIFDKGRKKANNSDYNLDNLRLSKDLCEFIGAFIGDGFTNKYNRSYLTQFIGHRKLDKKYHKNFLIDFANEQLGVSASLKEKNNYLKTNFYSKKLFILLTEKFRLPKGKKCYSIKIPSLIENSNKPIAPIIRGIFDTDGSIHFDRREVYKRPYPRIELNMKSWKLIQQIKKFLRELNLNTTGNKERVYINGKEEVKKYLQTIGFRNSRHINRLREVFPSMVEFNKLEPR